MGDEQTRRDQRARNHSTTVRRGDDRVAGHYEQAVDAPGESLRRETERRASSRRALALLGGSVAGLRVDGLCEFAGHLAFARLRALAGNDRLTTFDDCRIEIVDLLAQVRVDADAEVMSVMTPSGEVVAMRIKTLLADPGAHLELGGERPDGRRDWFAPMRLHGTTLPEERSIELASICFSSFADFISGRWPNRSPRSAP